MRLLTVGFLVVVAACSGSCSLTYDKYYSWEDVDKYMNDLAKANPKTVSVVKGGTSSEKRPIQYLKISSSNKSTEKPVIYLDGLNHANEWLTVPVITYVMKKLVEDNTEPKLLEKADWILHPIMNPDGYVYSWTKDRMWRKTRSKTTNDKCIGVDGNRNFEHGWNDPRGSSSDPCNATYAGPKAFSEPEARVVRDIMQKYKKRIVLYISVHAWGSRILYPYNVDGSLPENSKDLQSVGEAMATAINKLVDTKTFPKYVVGNAVAVVGSRAAGDQTDYARSLGIPLTFGIDLPGIGKNPDDQQGLVLDPKYIKSVVEQTWAGIVAGVNMAVKPK